MPTPACGWLRSTLMPRLPPREEAAGRVAAGVCKDADILGKVVAKRFGDCAVGPNDAQVLVRNG